MRIGQAGTFATLAAFALLAGCAGKRSGGNAFSGPDAEQEVKIFVTNLAFMDATIYAITNAGRIRLGRVGGTKEAVLTMPCRMPTQLSLEIDILAGPRCYTEELWVDPGDHLDLTLQNDFSMWRCEGG